MKLQARVAIRRPKGPHARLSKDYDIPDTLPIAPVIVRGIEVPFFHDWWNEEGCYRVGNALLNVSDEGWDSTVAAFVSDGWERHP
jgi:hypothetical protein